MLEQSGRKIGKNSAKQTYTIPYLPHLEDQQYMGAP